MPGEGLSAQPMRKVRSFIYNRFWNRYLSFASDSTARNDLWRGRWL